MKKLVYILLLVVSWPTFAAREFDVEIILFKRNINPDQVSESWPDQLKPLDMRGTMMFGNSDALATKGVSLLPPDQYQLTNQYQKLQNHAGFTPLAHVAWRQGDEGKGAAPKFHLVSGKDFSDRYLADGTSKAELRRRQLSAPDSTHDAKLGSDIVITIGQEAEDTDFDADAAGSKAPLYQLEGSIQVYVQHYLFADVNLDLREPGRREVIVGTEPLESDSIETETEAETESNVQVGHLQEVKKKVEVEEFLKSYRLSQQQRMRSGETHYLDHPLMGMIIQVRRVGE
ncbi:peptidoglycan binding protein CsiV [Photobacterium sp.]|uniref:peptidoglycan binding protein CsiV n=1 Tax=Photobacterium sp. TaxID=660 RepID=UPI00299F15D5|nr:peptidoglycan binding protein CsiV [Photobacterium sp.]MDX1301938.1 peptidoglycan binding protein CsiV [Photobacterium sp.]